MADSKERFSKNVVAIVYDFDGTLCPQPMQEYTVLPQIGIEPSEFWRGVNEVAEAEGEEKMLTYMRLLLEEADRRNVHVGKAEFNALAKKIEYFPGVETWFSRANEFVREQSSGRVQLRHYVVSSGLKEILDGASIRRQFHKVFASEYHYNHHGVATFPKLLITDTAKTQFLFRINKGRENLSESINSHMPREQRPVPFRNIIYIGDGETDVPSMAVTRQNGGTAVAVYPLGNSERARKKKQEARHLLAVGRVDFAAPADYRAGSALDRRITLLLHATVARIEYEREVFKCAKELGAGARTARRAKEQPAAAILEQALGEPS